MPPAQHGPLASNRVAIKSTVPRVHLTTKAARKQTQIQSDSSDSHSASASGQKDDSDSDVFQGRSDDGWKRHPARSNFTTKAARKMAPDVDSDSDNVTVRAEPSLLGAQPAQSRGFQPPLIAKQIKRKSRKPRGAAPEQVDIANDRSFKSVRNQDFTRLEASDWRQKFTQKAGKEGERRGARMSIGSSGQGRPSRMHGFSSADKRRQYFALHGRVWLHRRHGVSKRTNLGRIHDSDQDQDFYQPFAQHAAKAARKFQIAAKSAALLRRVPSPDWDMDTENEHDTIENNDIAADESTGEYLTDTSENDNGVALEHVEPSQTLLDGLERLSLSVVRLQKMRRLPFLRRNLRSGFQSHCQILGVDTQPRSLPRTPISVVYGCQLTDDASLEIGEFRTTSARSSMKDWLCPLCSLHNKFDNPVMLEKHLAWDHSSVKVHWNPSYTTLSLTIPESQPELNPVITRAIPIRELSTSLLASDSRHFKRKESTDRDDKSLIRISSTPSGATVESQVGSRSVTTAPTSMEEDRKPKYETPGYSNPVASGTRTGSSVSMRSASQALSGAGTQDGLQPSATYPYLPETDEKGDVYYSCRPGGPRLFDSLNTLSLRPYGVLKWLIIDREEELFELDDIIDEDKVMQALWFRWIFLNRNRFVANYFDGTKAFIRENWELIKQGAGLLALRTWLLTLRFPKRVLLVNNFLLPAEVSTLMQYYQGLANIQSRF